MHTIKYLLHLIFVYLVENNCVAETRVEALPVNRDRMLLKLAIERFERKKLLKAQN